MSSSPSPRIFVSYARADGVEPARKVRRQLEDAGLSLWQDLVALEGGRDWWSQIEEAIRAPSVEHLVLIVTQSVLERPVVRREVRLARQEGLQVTPVKGSDSIDLDALPRWFGHVHDLRNPEERERLVTVLRGPSTQKRVPFMAPDLPDRFVPRCVEFETLKARLLDAKGDAIGVTVALRGTGGYGKTVLANALCHDKDIQDAYFDGILHVVLGERPDNLLGICSDLIRMITGVPEGFNTIDAAASRLSETLGDRRFLLVIDDAWHERDLLPFLRGGPNTARLITTRNDMILPEGTVRLPVDAMRASEARELLARGLPDDQVRAQHPALAALARRLGEWPFLLAIVNGFLKNRVRRGESLARALDGVDGRLSEKGLVAFDSKDEGARDRAVARTIGVSLELLEVAERERFNELAVFPEDTDVPVGTVARLWRITADLAQFDSEDLLDKLFKLSLLSELDLARRTFGLHDVMRSYLITRAGNERLRELHDALASALRGGSESEGAWVATERDYFYRYFLMHLAASGDRAAVDKLLLDIDWMGAKLRATGPHRLVSDYRNLGRGRAQELVGCVLDLTTSILARDPTQLAAQLLGRLAPSDAEGLGQLLAQAAERLPGTALAPKRPTFTAPGPEIRRFNGHAGAVMGLVALSAKRFVSCSYDKTLCLWDVETAVQLHRFAGHDGAVLCLARLDDHRVVSGSEDRSIRIWDIETCEEVRRIDGHEGAVTCLSILDGNILSGSEDKTLRLWDAESGAELRRFDGHEGAVTCVAVAGATILSAGDDKTLRLWETATRAPARVLADGKELKRPIRSIAVLDDLRALTGGSDYRAVRIWDIESGSEVGRLEGFRFWADRIAVLNARHIAVGTGGYCEVDIWDVEKRQRLHRFGGHESSVLSVARLDERHVLSSDWTSSIRLWGLETNYQLERFKGLEWWVASFLVLDDRRVVSASWDGVVTLWDSESGQELLRFNKVHEHWVADIARLDEHRVVTCGMCDKSIRLWDVASGTELLRLQGHEQTVSSIAVLDASRVVSASADKTLLVWDANTGAELRRMTGHDGPVNSVVALDPHTAVSGSEDKSIRLWDVETGNELRRLDGHAGGVSAVSVVGRQHIISASADATLRLWHIETGTEVRRFEGHHDAVCDVVTIDPRHFVSASVDSTLRLWDLESGRELARYEGDTTFTKLSAQTDGTVAARDSVARLHFFDVRMSA